MNVEMETLKARIDDDRQAIEEIYAKIEQFYESDDVDEESRLIVVAYLLHNLYNAFESTFHQVAKYFENHLDSKSGRLNINGVRPAFISKQSYECLDELRRFRHVFRSAYRLQIDPHNLAGVWKKSQRLKALYPAEFAQFIKFLDTLT